RPSRRGRRKAWPRGRSPRGRWCATAGRRRGRDRGDRGGRGSRWDSAGRRGLAWPHRATVARYPGAMTDTTDTTDKNASANPFRPEQWKEVPGFGDLTDITYHRHAGEGRANGIVRI